MKLKCKIRQDQRKMYFIDSTYRNTQTQKIIILLSSTKMNEFKILEIDLFLDFKFLTNKYGLHFYTTNILKCYFLHILYTRDIKYKLEKNNKNIVLKLASILAFTSIENVKFFYFFIDK